MGYRAVGTNIAGKLKSKRTGYSINKLPRRLAAIKIPGPDRVHRDDRSVSYDYIWKEGFYLNADRQVGMLLANVGLECWVHPQDGTDLKYQEFMESSVGALESLANPLGRG